LQRNKISFIVFHRRGGSGCYRSSMKVVFLFCGDSITTVIHGAVISSFGFRCGMLNS
jgi:hypothetical protein